ncbi:MAG: CHAT domain-containing protein [Cyanobacteria bacterium]|nr:CHAT domain-containing protein [Cyanobacteriota bacterium]
MNPQEFHLSITPLGEDRYLIRTEDMAAGVPVAEAQVHWPVDQWLKRSQPAMDDPILGLLQGRSPAAASPGSDLKQLGAELYEALFHQDYIRESWSRAQGIAQNHRQILRLRLGFKDSRLQRLPWEVLQSHGKPLATRVDLTFARYSADLMAAQAAHPLNLPTGDEALQVLMVIANPDDQARLNLCQEVSDIQASLQPAPGEASRVDITVLEQPDRSALTQALEQGHYQVLHYAGHSDFGKTGGDLHLVNQQTGLTERLTGEDLAGLLVNNQICLAVFNSCRSGHTAGDDAEMDWRQQNLVQALVNRGVQSVIAMAERIPDQVAIQFTQLLYKNIQRGYPIDLSLGRTRQGLVSAFSSKQHYWALPVLYLQPEFDGYLTQRDRAKAAPLDPWQIDDWPITPPPELPAMATGTAETTATGALAFIETLTPKADADGHGLDESDTNLLQLVEQLSQPTLETDEPPIPADQGEVLLPRDHAQADLDIYGVLPENPIYRQSALDEQMDQDAVGEIVSASANAPEPSQLSRTRQKLSEKSLFAWMALGAVGLIGTLTLGVFTAQKAGLFSETTNSPVEAPVYSASTTSEVLLEPVIAALEQGDYPRASEQLAQALDPEVMAKVDADFLPTVLTVLENYEDPDILFVKGRAHWQRYVQLDADLSSRSNLEERQARTDARDAAISAWDTLIQDRPQDIEARVAIGFAYYASSQLNEALIAWEKAKVIEIGQREVRSDTTALMNPVVLNAYAGLILWHLNPQIANVEPGADEQQRSLALDEFQTLQALDEQGWLTKPGLDSTATTGQNPYLWLWSEAAQAEWSETSRDLLAALETGRTLPNPSAENQAIDQGAF